MSEWKNQVVPHWLATCTCCDRNCLSSARGQVRAFADEGRMSIQLSPIIGALAADWLTEGAPITLPEAAALRPDATRVGPSK